MISNAPRLQDTDESTATPWASLLQFQQDLIKLNLSASAEFSRRALQIIEAREVETESLPAAPMQMVQFVQDCMKLSLSPVSLLAAGALKPLTGVFGHAGAPSPSPDKT